MTLISGLRNIALPTKATGTNVTGRVDGYGHVYTNEAMTAAQTQAHQGSRFTALATPVVAGTGVVLGMATAFSDTLKHAVVITNTDAAGGKSVVLDYITGRVIVADTNGTSLVARCEIDSTNRYSSGGTALTVANQTPGATAAASIATVRVGDVTCGAAGTYRTHLGMQLIAANAAPVLVIDNTYVFSFGSQPGTYPQAVAGAVITTLASYSVPFGPAVIPPGGSFMLQLAIPAGDTTASQWQFQCGWAEL